MATVQTADSFEVMGGQSLKARLAKAERRNKVRAFMLVLPLLIFITFAFLLPIIRMMYFSFDNPVIVGMDRYYTVSQLSFHDPAREVAGRHLFGKDALMWAYWSDPAQFIGRDMLLVGYPLQSGQEENWGKIHVAGGAAIGFGWRDPPRGREYRVPFDPPSDCTLTLFASLDHELCINVLRRQRGGLLLAQSPLRPIDVCSLKELFWVNDAQLVRIARETGARKINP